MIMSTEDLITCQLLPHSYQYDTALTNCPICKYIQMTNVLKDTFSTTGGPLTVMYLHMILPPYDTDMTLNNFSASMIAYISPYLFYLDDHKLVRAYT